MILVKIIVNINIEGVGEMDQDQEVVESSLEKQWQVSSIHLSLKMFLVQPHLLTNAPLSLTATS